MICRSRQGKPLPGLDDTDEKGVLVGMADGSVRYVPGGDEALWRKLITPAAGEVRRLVLGPE